MDQDQPSRQEQSEIDSDVVMSDLPEESNDESRWSAQLSRVMLSAQRPAHRRSWRLAGIAGTALLSVVVLLLIFSGTRMILTPAPVIQSRIVVTPPTPTTINYQGFTYLSHPLAIFQGHNGYISVAWSPDGQRIAAGGRDDSVQVWNAHSGKHLLTYRGDTDDVEAIAWSPDGTRIASVSRDASAQVWDASSGKRLFIYHNQGVGLFSVAWSPDGTRIVFGADDGSVQVWNIVTGKRLLTYSGHDITVMSVAWSPDGTRIASGGLDFTVRVWNA